MSHWVRNQAATVRNIEKIRPAEVEDQLERIFRVERDGAVGIGEGRR